MIFPRTFFFRFAAAISPTARQCCLSLFALRKKVVKWVVELMLHRGGVGRHFRVNYFPYFYMMSEFFSHPLFQLQIIAKFFNFLLPTRSVHGCVLYCSPAGFDFDFMAHLSTSLAFDIREKSEINNANGCSRFKLFFNDNVHISYVVKPIVSHQTTIDDARHGKENI